MSGCWLNQDNFYHHKIWQKSNKVLQAICHILSHRSGRGMLPARGLLSSSDLLCFLHLCILWRHWYWVCKQADHRWKEITGPSPGFCLHFGGLRKPVGLQSNTMATSSQEKQPFSLRGKNWSLSGENCWGFVSEASWSWDCLPDGLAGGHVGRGKAAVHIWDGPSLFSGFEACQSALEALSTVIDMCFTNFLSVSIHNRVNFMANNYRGFCEGNIAWIFFNMATIWKAPFLPQEMNVCITWIGKKMIL